MSTDSSSDGSDGASNVPVHLSSVFLDHLVGFPEKASDRTVEANRSLQHHQHQQQQLKRLIPVPTAGPQPTVTRRRVSANKGANRHHHKEEMEKKQDAANSSDNDGASHSRGQKSQPRRGGDADATASSCSKKHKNAVSDSSNGKRSASETDDEQAGWTISEDCLLRGMKDESTDNVSWVDIAAALHRTKSDVKARWKVIKDARAGQAEAGGQGECQDHEGQPTEAPSSSNDSSTRTCEAKTPPPASSSSSSEPCALTRQHRNHTPPNQKVHPETTPAKPMPTPPCAPSPPRNGHPDHSVRADEPDSELSERIKQKRYLYRDIYGCLYPPALDLQPDSLLNQDDCATLATIASKYDQNRLLEMQANFLNAAGRNIPISYLRAKLLGAQGVNSPEEHEEQNKIARVKKWIDQVQGS
ncbi:hypothetical protein E4U55_004624 [Claviceps digitariae]|nr:hypothetical protein E4U55_004624 [Claviceps digitariae]